MGNIYAIAMFILLVVPVLVIYNLMQENFEPWPELNLPEAFTTLSFVCIDVLIILSFLLNKSAK